MNLLSHSTTLIFQEAIFEAPSSTPDEDRDMHLLSFFYNKFNSEQCLFEAFFDIIGIFCYVQP